MIIFLVLIVFLCALFVLFMSLVNPGGFRKMFRGPGLVSSGQDEIPARGKKRGEKAEEEDSGRAEAETGEDDDIELMLEQELVKIVSALDGEFKDISEKLDSLSKSDLFGRNEELEALQKQMAELNSLYVQSLPIKEQEKTSLENKIRQLNTQIKEIQENIVNRERSAVEEQRQLGKDYEKLKKAYDEKTEKLEREIKQVSADLEDAEKMYGDIKKEDSLAAAPEELQSLRQQLADFQKEIQAEIQGKQLEKSVLLLKLEDTRNKIKEQVNLSEEQKKIIHQKTELETKLSVVKEIYTGQSASYDREIEALKAQLEALQAEQKSADFPVFSMEELQLIEQQVSDFNRESQKALQEKQKQKDSLINAIKSAKTDPVSGEQKEYQRIKRDLELRLEVLRDTFNRQSEGYDREIEQLRASLMDTETSLPAVLPQVNAEDIKILQQQFSGAEKDYQSRLMEKNSQKETLLSSMEDLKKKVLEKNAENKQGQEYLKAKEELESRMAILRDAFEKQSAACEVETGKLKGELEDINRQAEALNAETEKAVTADELKLIKQKLDNYELEVQNKIKEKQAAHKEIALAVEKASRELDGKKAVIKEGAELEKGKKALEQRLIDIKNVYEDQSAAYDREIEELKADLEKLKEENEKAQNDKVKISGGREEIETLKQQIMGFELESQKKIQAKKNEKETVLASIEELHQQLIVAEDLLSSSTGKLQSEKEELGARLEEMKNAYEKQSVVYRDEVSKLSAFLSELNDQIKNVDVDTIRKEVEDLEYKHNDLLASLERELKHDAEQLRMKDDIREKIKNETIEKTKIIEEQKARRLNELNQKNTGMKKDLEFLRFTINEEIARSGNMKRQMEDEIKRLNGEIDRIRKDSQDSGGLVIRKKQIEDEVEVYAKKLSDQKSQFNEQLKKKTEEISLASAENKGKEEAILMQWKKEELAMIEEQEKLKKTIAQLQVHSDKLKKTAKFTEDDLDKQVQNLQRKLKNSQLQFMNIVQERENREKALKVKLTSKINVIKNKLKEETDQMQQKLKERDNEIYTLKTRFSIREDKLKVDLAKKKELKQKLIDDLRSIEEALRGALEGNTDGIKQNLGPQMEHVAVVQNEIKEMELRINKEKNVLGKLLQEENKIEDEIALSEEKFAKNLADVENILSLKEKQINMLAQENIQKEKMLKDEQSIEQTLKHYQQINKEP